MLAMYEIVEIVGEMAEREKADFLGNADALLFPIDWPEPFGLVVVEAMACGTPVIAFSCGSAPEIIDNGASGFLVSDISEAVAAVQRVGSLDRAKARESFDRRFTIERVASDYMRIYRSLPGLRKAARLGRAGTEINLSLVASANRAEEPFARGPGGRTAPAPGALPPSGPLQTAINEQGASRGPRLAQEPGP